MSACVYTHTNKRTGEVFYVGSIGPHPRDLRPAVRGPRWGQYFREVLGSDASAIEVNVIPMPDVGEALAAEWDLICQHLPVANPGTAVAKDWGYLKEVINTLPSRG